MPRTTSLDSFANPSQELHEALQLLRNVVNLSSSLQAARDFRDEIEFLRRRQARLHLFDLIDIIDQTIPSIANKLIQARSSAGAAFIALNAKDRQGMRIFHKEDLRTYLDVRNADDPPNPSSPLFQNAQSARSESLELERKLFRYHLRWFRENMPNDVLDDPDIREQLRKHAAEVDRMEVDQITAGRELHRRFRNMTRDDQFLFLRWYQPDIATNGIHWNGNKHKFGYVGVRTALHSARPD